MRREANRLWRCFDFISAEALTNVPPLQTNNLTLQHIIAHRDIKVKYLLTMVCDRVRECGKAKGLKDPVKFKDSMIVLTPQKGGDSSDPHMPLNFAPGKPEPEPESQTYKPPVRVDVSIADMHTGTAHLPPILSVEDGLIPAEFLSILDDTASAWASSSETFSPWVRYGELGLDGDNYAMLYPTNDQSYAASTMTGRLSASQYVDVRSGHASIESQMLEIDWNFGTLSFPHRPMMVIWMFQMITC